MGNAFGGVPERRDSRRACRKADGLCLKLPGRNALCPKLPRCKAQTGPKLDFPFPQSGAA